MKVKNKKDGSRTFTYSGDLEKEISKVGKMNAVAQNLIGLRRACNLERKDVCKALGLLPTSYARYETGLRVPDIELLGKFARYYNVTIDYLTGHTDLVSKEEYFQEVLEMIADMGGCSGAMASEALNAWNK